MKSFISGTSGGSASVPESMSACAENYKSQPNGPLDPVITRSISTGNMSCTTDDSCAINELLEGRMDLNVVLPAPLFESKKQEKVVINVERRQPMMDLLVNIATQFKFNAANYKINVDGHDFKANTPIGSLDVNEVTIVPKKSKHTINKPANEVSTTCVSGHQLNASPTASTVPFKTTFRLQVNLPRNQLMVLRVTPNASIAQIKQLVCCEKGLDPLKYQLVVCDKQPQVLDPNKSLAFYAINEITLMTKKSIAEAQLQYSTSSTCAPGCEPKKVILSLLNATNQAVNSRENSRSSFAEKQQIPTSKPTKKRPAPQPPAARLKETQTNEVLCKEKKSSLVKKNEPKQKAITGHTRQNSESDSSGYHESMLSSDSPECPPSVTIENVIIEESCSKKVMKKRKAPLPPATQQVKETRDKFEANESMSEVSVPLSSASESSSGASQTSDYRTVTASCCSLNGQLNESLSTGNISYPYGSSTPKLDALSQQREEKVSQASLMEGSLEAAYATDCRRDSMNAITDERLNNDRNVSESEHAIVVDEKVLPSFSPSTVSCTVSVSAALDSTSSSPENCALVNNAIDKSLESDYSLTVFSDKQKSVSDDVNTVNAIDSDIPTNTDEDLKAESLVDANLSNEVNGEDLQEDETEAVQGLLENTIEADGLLPPPPSFSDSVSQTMPGRTNETIDCITNCELVSKGGNDLKEQLFEATFNSDLHAAASVDVKDDDYFSDPCVHSFGEETNNERVSDCDKAAVKKEAIENCVAETAIAADSTTVTKSDKSAREASEADLNDYKSASSKQSVEEIHEIEANDTIDDLTPLPPPSPFRNCNFDADTVKCDHITDGCVVDTDSKTNDEEYIEEIKTHGEALRNCVSESVEPKCEKMEQMKVTTASDSHSLSNQHSILVQIKSDKSPISSTRIRVKSNPIVEEKQEYSRVDECNENCNLLDLSSVNSQNALSSSKNVDITNDFASITSNEVRFLCRPRKKLTNFKIGSYKNDEGPNIYGNGSESNDFNSVPPKTNNETRLPHKTPSKPVVVTASLKPKMEDTIASEISAVPDSSTIKQTVQILPKSSTTRISMISPQPFKLNRISSWNGNEKNLTMPAKHFADDSSSKPATIFEINNQNSKSRCVSQVDINKDSTKVSVRSTPNTPSAPSSSKSPDVELKTPLLIPTSRTKSSEQQKTEISESKCVIKQIPPSHSPSSTKSQMVEIRHESTTKHSSAALVVKSVPAPIFPTSQRNGSSSNCASNGLAKSTPPPPPMPDKDLFNSSSKKHVSKCETNAKNSKNVPNSNKKVIATNGKSNVSDFHEALLNEIRNFKGGKPSLKKVSTNNPWQSSFNSSDCN